MQASDTLPFVFVLITLACSSDYTIAESRAAMNDSTGGASSVGSDEGLPALRDPEGGTSLQCSFGAIAGPSEFDPEATLSCRYYHDHLTESGPVLFQSIDVRCDRDDPGLDWPCDCIENEETVISFTLPADTVITEAGLYERCGWSDAFISCFYRCRTIADCREP